jgi:hypothetical protein
MHRGWTGSNFSANELPFMLAGHMADGFKMGAVPMHTTPSYNPTPTAVDMVRIHYFLTHWLCDNHSVGDQL